MESLHAELKRIVGCGDELVMELVRLIEETPPAEVLDVVCQRVGAGEAMRQDIGVLLAEASSAVRPTVDPLAEEVI